MGQARNRGTREDRIQQAQERNMADAKRRIRQYGRIERDLRELAGKIHGPQGQTVLVTGDDPAQTAATIAALQGLEGKVL